MIEEIKILLGDAAQNYTDAQIGVCLKKAIIEIETYTKRDLDRELENIAEEIAIIKLNRLHTEGLGGQSLGGVSETYIDGYPAHIQQALNRKRKIKVIY